MGREFFGTDGVRGVPNQGIFTVENIMALGRAIAYLLKEDLGEDSHRRNTIVIGRDTRSSGHMIEQALGAGITAMGVDILFVGSIPTPGIAFLASDMRADAGIVISASHNHFKDNGIKVFDKNGYKLPDSVEERLESLMFSDEIKQNLVSPRNVGKIKHVHDAKSRYIVFAKKSFPKTLSLKGLRIVLDCANGAAYRVAPLIFEELGAEVISLNIKPDGVNINHDCGALHPHNLKPYIEKYRADIGITLDGDADRVILLDENGEIVDGDIVMAILAKHLKDEDKLYKNTIVVTPMSNFGLGVAMKKQGIKLVEAPVGDRYVVEQMRNKGYNFGGEQSGHIIFLDHATTGDGIIGALQVLAVMLSKEVKLSELAQIMQKFPQVLKNITINHKKPIKEMKSLAKLIKKIEKEMDSEGRVLVRYSGTEMLARVMVEGKDEFSINKYADEIIEELKIELRGD